LLVVLSIVAMALVGTYQLDPAAFKAAPFDQVYRVVQLFFAEGDWTNGQELPVLLELARLLAPIVAVASLLVLFAEGIWTAVVNSRVRLYKRHIVVAGLSDSAMVFIRDCRVRKLAVVAIERDVGNPHVADCRRLLVPVIVGDAKNPDVLHRARVRGAKSLLSLINDDDSNVELSLQVQASLEGVRPLASDPLKVILRIEDMQLGGRLESYPKFFDYPQQVEVRFFNLEEQAARALFLEFHPDVYADALGMRAVHIAIIGYSTVGRHVLSAAIKQAHYGNQEPLVVTVLDPNADAARQSFERQCPGVGLVADVRFVSTGVSPEEIREDVSNLGIDDATMIVSCTGSDSDNLSMALAVRQMGLLSLLPNAPIFVSLRNSGGLARLVESGQGNPEIPDGLYPFGMMQQLMRVDLIVNEELDRLAVGFHERFLQTVGEGSVTQASHRPWGLLQEVFRNGSRAQADHVETKLRAAGYRIAGEPYPFEFDDLEITRLAQMEKCRWNAERTTLGWSYADQRSDLAKVTPALKPWEETSSEERTYDIDLVRAIPTLVRDCLGAGIGKEIVIGITGHRAHRVATHLDFVKSEVRKELEAIRATYPKAEFVVMSALADGSDRIVADLAVEILHARLHAALPLPYEVYKREFGHSEAMSNTESNEEFQRFVGRASLYFEMPLRSGGVQVLERDDETGDQARAKQYALAGAFIVSRAHELIAVWDGREARGVGGTGEVVSWREAGQVPEAYRFPGHFFPSFPLTPPRVIYLPDEGKAETANAVTAG
jgi:Trk K+ transport system NAD-binding subunit